MSIKLDLNAQAQAQGAKRKEGPATEERAPRQRIKVTSVFDRAKIDPEWAFSEKTRTWKIAGPLKVSTGEAEGAFGRVYQVAPGPHSSEISRVVKFQERWGRASGLPLSPLTAHNAEREMELLDELGKFRARHIIKQYDTASIKGKKYASLLEYAGPQLRDIYFGPNNLEGKKATLDDIERLGRQFMEALIDLKRQGILHGDFKPENCGEKDGQLRVFDFGNALKIGNGKSKNLLYTQPYRPPETVLKMGTSFAGDMWAVGCILFELAANEMLNPICFGKSVEEQHFKMIFSYSDRLVPNEKEPQFQLTTEDFRKKWQKFENFEKYEMPSHHLDSFEIPIREALKSEEPQRVEQFIALLKKMLQIDPLARITPEDALEEPFLKGSDLSFHLQMRGVHQVGLRILNQQGASFLQIRNVQDIGYCYHIPRSETPYKFEFFNPAKSDIVLSSHEVKIKPYETVDMNADLIPESVANKA